MAAEHAVPRSHILKLYPGTDVGASVAYFEKHLVLKSDGNNSKRAVVSASKNPDSLLKSLCIKGRKQELCDGVDDVACEIEDVEEIAIIVPQILAQMVERTADVPQTSTRPYPVLQLQTVNVP